MADEPNLRAPIVAALTESLPADEWVIIGFPDTPTRIAKRTVAVWAATIEPAPRLKAGHFAVEMTLEVTTASQDVRKADDDLDGAVLAVLDVLLAMPSIVFVRAERTTNDDKTQHSWTVTVQQVLTAIPTAPTPED